MKIEKLIKSMWVLAFIAIFNSCGSTIALFDQYAYTQTTSLKVDVLNLMDKSSEAYTSHETEVASVVSDLMKMREYERHRPKDQITYAMWNKLIDSTGQKGIIGIFLVNWKKDNTEGQTFITDFKGQASEGFNYIAELESTKIKSSDAGVQKFLTK